MRDFFDYVKPEVEGKPEISGNAMDILSSLSEKYEGKDANEIMRDILAEADKGRKNGTLSDADIDNFVSVISPMLNDKQKKALDKVVVQLKRK